jgi:hypothetical protein
MVQGLGKAGDVTRGLTPALPSSVAPRGIEPTGATPGAAPAEDPLKVEGAMVVPDAVPPAPQEENVGVPVEATPALSKVEKVLVVPDMPVPAMPVMEELVADIPGIAHGLVLAVGSSGIGLRPPGESSVAPSGTPTGAADDVAPGTPSGEVAPIAGAAGVSGAICAKLTPVLSSNSSDPITKLFKATSRCAMPRN